MALARWEVENAYWYAARGLVDGAAIVRIELVSRAVGRLRATSIVRGFADAIVWLLVAVLLLRGGIWRSQMKYSTLMSFV